MVTFLLTASKVHGNFDMPLTILCINICLPKVFSLYIQGLIILVSVPVKRSNVVARPLKIGLT